MSLEDDVLDADRLLLLAPEAEPPSGFAERVLARLATFDRDGRPRSPIFAARRCARP